MHGVPKNLVPDFIDERILEILTRISKSSTEKANLIERSKIVLLSLDKKTTFQIADELGVHRNTAGKWRKRFFANLDQLNEKAKVLKKAELRREVIAVLSDEARPGAPRKYDSDQRAQIIGIACSKLDDYQIEDYSHWTLKLIRNTAINLEIIDSSVSIYTIYKILNDVDIKPHKYKGWLNRDARTQDPEEYDRRISNVNEVYAMAKDCPEDTHIISVDEKTGISARERHCQDIPASSGHCLKMEQGYRRNGFLNLTADFEISTGKIIGHGYSVTHKEADFLKFIQGTVNLFPKDQYIFVLDNYSTHVSESLVRFVIDECQLNISEEQLGKKRVKGILFDMNSRRAFLEDKSHRIRFVYTPKHASWMNQIEIWFSYLARRLTNRGSFTSKQELMTRIDSLIGDYNTTAHPYQWTFNGKLLQA